MVCEHSRGARLGPCYVLGIPKWNQRWLWHQHIQTGGRYGKLFGYQGETGIHLLYGSPHTPQENFENSWCHLRLLIQCSNLFSRLVSVNKLLQKKLESITMPVISLWPAWAVSVTKVSKAENYAPFNTLKKHTNNLCASPSSMVWYKSWTLMSMEGENLHGLSAEITQVRAFNWKKVLVRATGH